MRCHSWILISLLSVSACSESPSSPSTSTFTFISGAAIDTLDPQRTSWLIDFRMIECLFEPLLKVHPNDMQLHPAAAQTWELSDDQRVYTFHLRPDAKWSNGDPVKASDYVYAWRRAILPDSAADYTGLFFCIKGARAFFDFRTEQLKQYAAIAARAGGGSDEAASEMWIDAEQQFHETVGIQALDEHTLRVELEQPTGYFLELCAFATLMPVHEPSVRNATKLHAESGALRTRSTYFSNPNQLVGNGPYVLREWAFKERMVLEQNQHYWNRRAMGNQRIVQHVVENPTTALLRYENGEVDWLPDIPTASDIASSLVASGRSDVHVGPAAGTYFYLFNCRPTVDDKPNPLVDWRVRRALSQAVDRNYIVQRVTRIDQPVALSFVPPGAISSGYEPPVAKGARFDPAQARRLLAEAGHAEGRGLEGLSILYNLEGAHERAAQAIQQMWEKELGVIVTLEGVEKARFRERRRQGDFTIARGGWFGDYRDPTTFLDMFRIDDGNNDAKYHNAEYERLLDRAARQGDPLQRMALLQDAEGIILHEQPLMPIYQYTNLDVFDPARVQGLFPNEWNIRRFEAVQLN